MINLFKRKRRTGCPVCYDNRTVGFGFDLLESKYDSRIEKDLLIGKTQTYRCHKCNSLFYQGEFLIQKIEPERIEILKEYWKTEHKISPQLLAQLELIGLTTDWSLGNLAPAMIELYDGRIFDFATVRVCKKPPISSYSLSYKNIFFIEEIKHIKPSKYALSKEIREKSALAEEMRMGFYPTVLTAQNNTKTVINIETIFFKKDHIAGAELRLADEHWNHREKYLYSDKIEQRTLVVAR